MFRSIWLCGLVSASLFAWGMTGHRVVADIAQHHLTEKTKQWMDDQLHVNSLVWLANWADDIRVDPSQSHPQWHYAHIETLGEENDMVWAYHHHLAILKDKKKPVENRVKSLKWIVHLVGDLHQPLHISKKKMRGYVGCQVRFMSSNRIMSLHQVWDSGLIDAEKLSYSEWRNFLAHQPIQVNLDEDPKSWVMSSYHQHESMMPEGVLSGCKTHAKQRISRSDMPFLSWHYRAKAIPVLSQQLWLAGIRLAHVMNEVAND